VPLFTLCSVEDASRFRLGQFPAARAIVPPNEGRLGESSQKKKSADAGPYLQDIYVTFRAWFTPGPKNRSAVGRGAHPSTFAIADYGGGPSPHHHYTSGTTAGNPKGGRLHAHPVCCSAICPMSKWALDFLSETRGSDVDPGGRGRGIRRAVRSDVCPAWYPRRADASAIFAPGKFDALAAMCK